jgi:hypothetical protein
MLWETCPQLLLLSDFSVHITPIRIVHYDTKTSLIHKALAIANDIGMAKGFQNMNFVKRLLLLFSIHP